MDHPGSDVLAGINLCNSKLAALATTPASEGSAARSKSSWTALPLEIRQRVLSYSLADINGSAIHSGSATSQSDSIIRSWHRQLGHLLLISPSFTQALLHPFETHLEGLQHKLTESKALRDTADDLLKWPQQKLTRSLICRGILRADECDCVPAAMIEAHRLYRAFQRNAHDLELRAKELRLEVASLIKLIDVMQYWTWRLRGELGEEEYVHRARSYLQLVWKEPGANGKDLDGFSRAELSKLWASRDWGSNQSSEGAAANDAVVDHSGGRPISATAVRLDAVSDALKRLEEGEAEKGTDCDGRTTR